MDQFILRLQKHHIRYTEYSAYAPYFRKRWEEAFINHLTDQEKEQLFLYGDRYICGYLWHVFTYHKRPYDMGVVANEAFELQNKTKCYVFHQRLPEVLVIDQGDALKAHHFEYEEDIYIVDEHFTWTYVVTHASDFGPFFSRV